MTNQIRLKCYFLDENKIQILNESHSIPIAFEINSINDLPLILKDILLNRKPIIPETNSQVLQYENVSSNWVILTDEKGKFEATYFERHGNILEEKKKVSISPPISELELDLMFLKQVTESYHRHIALMRNHKKWEREKQKLYQDIKILEAKNYFKFVKVDNLEQAKEDLVNQYFMDKDLYENQYIKRTHWIDVSDLYHKNGYTSTVINWLKEPLEHEKVTIVDIFEDFDSKSYFKLHLNGREFVFYENISATQKEDVVEKAMTDGIVNTLNTLLKEAKSDERVILNYEPANIDATLFVLTEEIFNYLGTLKLRKGWLPKKFPKD
jgi:hypothetical protein